MSTMMSKSFVAGNLPNGGIGWQLNVRAHCGTGLRFSVCTRMVAVGVAALNVEGDVLEMETHRVQPQRWRRLAACVTKAPPVSDGTQRVERTSTTGFRKPWLHASVCSSGSETSFD